MRVGSGADSAVGFTLIEVLIALALLAGAGLALATVVLRASREAAAARRQTIETTMAVERMEQLRGLTWGWDGASPPARVSDATTNLSTAASSSGGRGLATSPPDSLDVNEDGYVDFADARGKWVGAGTMVPPEAVFARRWRVSFVPSVADALVFEVKVEPVGGGRSRSGPADSVRFVTVKGRKAG
jgi:prepilin-type N-terminal cleavage/methylation domain-containing protein